MTEIVSRSAPARRSHRVLLVDDSVEFTDIVKSSLLDKRQPTWIVHTANDYSAALNCLKVHPMDLVVLDINMPVMDGLQLLNMLKRSYPSLPVVLLSAMVTPENRNYALQQGAALVLSKLDISNGFDSIYPALEATAEMPLDGFKGMVRQVGLTEVLQLECLGLKSSVLEIKGGEATGRIYISEGCIIHAEVGDIFGEKALARLFGLKGGEFHLKPFTQPARQTIDGQWEALLMEAAQSTDELAGDLAAQELASADNSSSTAVVLPVDGDRRVEEIVLSSSANDVLYQWNTSMAEKRVTLLSWLYARSSSVSELLPALGRPDRLEIREARNRVICVLQQETKTFVRLSINSPNP
jgi:CheY-like chemotaxis protein